jgi:hypothetical protein
MKKLFKTKSVIALALALFMVMPMLFAALPVKADSSNPLLSVVLSGTTTHVTSLPAVAVGQSFNVDVYLSNTGSVVPGINAYSYGVTFDPTVLSVTNTADGTYLGSKGQALGDLPPDNVNGVVVFGSSIVDTAHPDAHANGNGVIGTITFTVLKVAQSNLNLQPSDTGVAYLSYPDSSGTSHDVVADISNTIYNQMFTSISLYQSGTMNSVVHYTGGNPVGSYVSVDVYMNNPFAEHIWAWNLGVNWNAASLQLVNITEGTYMNPTPGLNDGSATLFIAGFIDNTAGNIRQGISDIYLTNTTTTATSGVMATLTFQIINYANSNLNLTAGTPTLMDNYGVTQNVNVMNNATYVSSAPPAAQNPVARITNQVPAPADNMGNYLPGQTITLDGLASTGGIDVIPNPMAPNFPILSYTWAQSGTPITAMPTSGDAITFQLPNDAAPHTYTISLKVATAPNPGDQNYVNTSTTSITFSSTPLGPASGNGPTIDVYLVNQVTNATQDSTHFYKNPLGYGFNTASDAFGPQESMNVAAFVAWNSGSVASKQVTFQVIDNHGQIISTTTSWTDITGTAVASFRLPWFDNSTNGASTEFGGWTVKASVDISQNYAVDNMPFQFGYLLNMAQPTVSNSQLSRSTSSNTTMSVVISSISTLPKTFYMTYTVYDNNSVPVTMAMVQGQVLGNGATTAVANINVPTWTFCGGATVKVDIFNYNPLVAGQHALPYCPEQTVGLVVAP